MTMPYIACEIPNDFPEVASMTRTKIVTYRQILNVERKEQVGKEINESVKESLSRGAQSAESRRVRKMRELNTIVFTAIKRTSFFCHERGVHEKLFQFRNDL